MVPISASRLLHRAPVTHKFWLDYRAFACRVPNHRHVLRDPLESLRLGKSLGVCFLSDRPGLANCHRISHHQCPETGIPSYMTAQLGCYNEG